MPVPSPTTSAAAVAAVPGVEWSVIGSVATSVGVPIGLYVALSGAWRQRTVEHRDQANRVSAHLEMMETQKFEDQHVAVPDKRVIVARLQRGRWSRGPLSERHGFLFWYRCQPHRCVLPPGRFEMSNPKCLVDQELIVGLRGVTITFTDGNGVAWERDARGAIAEIKLSPAETLGLPEPLRWAVIESTS